jgi:hypothetical protein
MRDTRRSRCASPYNRNIDLKRHENSAAEQLRRKELEHKKKSKLTKVSNEISVFSCLSLSVVSAHSQNTLYIIIAWYT